MIPTNNIIAIFGIICGLLVVLFTFDLPAPADHPAHIQQYHESPYYITIHHS